MLEQENQNVNSNEETNSNLNQEVSNEPTSEIKEEKVETKENNETEKEKLTQTQIINIKKNIVEDVVIGKEEDGIDFNEAVEEKRANFFAKYKKEKKLSNIVTMIVMVVVVAAFIMIVNENQGVKIGGYCIAGVAIVAMLVYYFLAKNKLPDTTKDYIRDISLTLNKHVFDDDRYKDLKTNENTKLELPEILTDRVYKDCTDIGTRNVVTGHFEEARIRVADLALYRSVSKKQRDVNFVGKYITLENKLKFDGRIIISIAGEKEVDTPTDIDDLTVIYENEEKKMKVYGLEGKNYNELLPSKIIEMINHIKVKDALIAAKICFWAGHTAIYLSYDDSVITLPFDKEFKGEATTAYRDTLLDILEVLVEY